MPHYYSTTNSVDTTSTGIIDYMKELSKDLRTLNSDSVVSHQHFTNCERVLHVSDGNLKQEVVSNHQSVAKLIKFRPFFRAVRRIQSTYQRGGYGGQIVRELLQSTFSRCS